VVVVSALRVLGQDDFKLRFWNELTGQAATLLLLGQVGLVPGEEEVGLFFEQESNAGVGVDILLELQSSFHLKRAPDILLAYSSVQLFLDVVTKVLLDQSETEVPRDVSSVRVLDDVEQQALEKFRSQGRLLSCIILYFECTLMYFDRRFKERHSNPHGHKVAHCCKTRH